MNSIIFKTGEEESDRNEELLKVYTKREIETGRERERRKLDEEEGEG